MFEFLPPTPDPMHLRHLCILSSLLVAACASDELLPPPDVEVELVYVSGRNQSGTVATALDDSLLVRVVDDEGSGVAGVPTLWRIVTGGGALSSTSVISDDEGYAAVAWTLGVVAGTSLAEAALDLSLGGHLFAATVLPGPAASVIPVALDNRVRIGMTATVIAQVVDAYGNPVPGVPVTWVAKQGSATPVEDTSNAGGLIQTNWTRGPLPGQDTLEVHLPNVTDPIGLVSTTSGLKWSQGATWSWSSPAIAADGTIYYGTRSGELRAVHPDGSAAWSYVVGTTVDEAPSIGADGTVYVTSYPQSGLRAISPAGGLLWTFPTTNGVRGTPAVGGDGAIYILALGDSLYAVSPAGTRLWAYPVPSATDDSPVVGADGTIYAPAASSGELHAIGPDGSHDWTYVFPGPPLNNDLGTPAIGADGTIYVTAQDMQLHALSPQGTELWATPVGSTPIAAKSSPSIGPDGTIYVGAFGNGIYAVSPTGTVLWNTSAFTIGFVFGTPLLRSDGSIVYLDVNGILYAVSSAGTLLWADQATAGSSSGSPALAPDGSIYLTTSVAGLVAFEGGFAPAAAPWPMFMKDQFHSGRQE